MTNPIPQPRFAFRQNNVVVMDQQNWVVQQRLGTGQWMFLHMETGEPRMLADEEIARRQREGGFHLHPSSSKRTLGPEPLSPIIVGTEGREANLRKHAYVEACRGLPRSRRALRPTIAAVAEERGEAAPGFTTVLLWLDEHEVWGATLGTAAYSDRHDLKGGRGSRLPAHLERALDAGIDAWLQLQNGDLAYAVVEKEVRRIDEQEGFLVDKCSLPKRYVDDAGRLLPPSRRTLERRYKSLDRLTLDIAQFGEGAARKHCRTWATREIPDRPYQDVEVDHCTLDITLIDPAGLVVGRPDLVCFRDRATAMILGIGLGFEAPSYASFMEGLKHAIYPKDLVDYPDIENPWPCFGRIGTLIVDGALHFLGDSIQNAGRELGFDVQVCPKRQPWMKGGLERFFGTLGNGLVHRLPGTTLSNVVERRDHEHLVGPVLTIGEFKHLLIKWICDIYHVDVTKALGPIRGIGAQPLQQWTEKGGRFVTPPLPSPDLFTALAGQVSVRTIQKDGIAWDYIKYESPELDALLRHPDHRRRSSEGAASRYRVLRDPQDLGEIVVVDPYRNIPIRVPATNGHRAYADGLTLHQHQVILANAKAANREVDHKALLAAKASLAELSMRLLNHPGRRGVEKAVARFIGADLARRHRSYMQPAPNSKNGNQKRSLLNSRPVHRAAPETTTASHDVQATDIDTDLELETLRRQARFEFHVIEGGPLA